MSDRGAHTDREALPWIAGYHTRPEPGRTVTRKRVIWLVFAGGAVAVIALGLWDLDRRLAGPSYTKISSQLDPDYRRNESAIYQVPRSRQDAYRLLPDPEYLTVSEMFLRNFESANHPLHARLTACRTAGGSDTAVLAETERARRERLLVCVFAARP